MVCVQHVCADLEPHEFEQLERRHRKTEGSGRLFNDLERSSGIHRVHGFAEHLSEDAVHYETRSVCRDDGILAQVLRGHHGGREGLVVGVGCLDDLDQRHDGNRVEEVEAHDTFRVLQLGTNLLDRK